MYDRALEAQHAVQAARGKVVQALNRATAEGDTADVARHLTCLNYALMACEFTAAEAVNAARILETIRSHYTHATEGGERGS